MFRYVTESRVSSSKQKLCVTLTSHGDQFPHSAASHELGAMVADLPVHRPPIDLTPSDSLAQLDAPVDFNCAEIREKSLVHPAREREIRPHCIASPALPLRV